MKRFLALLFLLLCTCLLGACAGGHTPTPSGVPETTAPQPHVLPELNAAESAAMARFQCGGRALLADRALYTFDFDAEGHPVLARYRLRSGSLGRFRILAEDCVPEYLSLYDGRLYYINGRTRAIESIGTDGSDRTVLVEDACDFLQLFQGCLRYTDSAGRYCEAGLDGGNAHVLIDTACYYPYSLPGIILYQCHADGERLHVRWLEDGEDWVLSAGAAYAPLLLGDRLYYNAGDRLYSLNLDGADPKSYVLADFHGELELLPRNGKLMLRGLVFGESIHQWEGSLSAWEDIPQGYRLCEYLDEDVRVDCVYEPDGRIRCFALVDAAGEITYLAGSVESSKS